MTTIISRVFQDEAAARTAANRINFRGVPNRAIYVITATDDDVLAAKMDKALVHESAHSAYAKHVKDGRALLVVRATYKPLTAATIVRDMLAKMDTVDTGDIVQEHEMPDGPEIASSVLREHPLFLTVRPNRTGYSGGPVTAGFGFGLLSRRRARASVNRGGGFKSRLFWPMPLLSKKKPKSSVISGGRQVSKTFWPTGLLSTKRRGNSVITGGDLPLSRALGWPPVS
ncbi:MAG: hypothetical protein AAF214_07830 [Pseudomonadota bacterium]